MPKPALARRGLRLLPSASDRTKPKPRHRLPVTRTQPQLARDFPTQRCATRHRQLSALWYHGGTRPCGSSAAATTMKGPGSYPEPLLWGPHRSWTGWSLIGGWWNWWGFFAVADCSWSASASGTDG